LKILDVADGKQARKTGNSTALGMLFDHGCDMITIFLILAFCIAVFRFEYDENCIYGILLILIFINPLYFQILEIFFFRRLDLPLINGLTLSSLKFFLLFLLDQVKGYC